MVRSIDATVADHLNQLHDELPWIWLYEAQVLTSPATRYRMTNYTQQVYFDKNSLGEDLIYYPMPIVHSGLRTSKSGDLPSMTVTVGNVSREVGRTVDEQNGMIGAAAVIRLVNLAKLDDPLSAFVWRTNILGVHVTHEAVAFDLAPINLKDKKLPPWRYMSNSCRRVFGGASCGYVIPYSPTESVGGGFSTCAKTWEECEERGDDEAARAVEVKHPLRFGGFRGIPRSW